MNGYFLRRLFLYSVSSFLYALGFTLLTLICHPDAAEAQTASTDTSGMAAMPLSRIEGRINHPDATVQWGNFSVERGQKIDVALVVIDGNAFISGAIDGDLVVINGSVSLQREAVVSGDILVVGGHIYASKNTTVKGQRYETDNRYVMSRQTGLLRLQRYHPPPMALKFQPEAWRFNRVRGHDFDITLGVEPTRPVWYPTITGTVSIPTVQNNHGFLDFKASIEEPLFERHTLRLRVEAYKTTDTNDGWHIPGILNGAAAFVTHNDYYNYFVRRGLTASARQKISDAFTIGIAYRHDTFLNLGAHEPFTLFGRNSPFRVNPDIDEGDIRSLALSVNYDTMPVDEVAENAWYFDAEVERAFKPFGSDFEYIRFDITARRYNHWRGHHFDLRAKFAGSDSPLPLQRSYVLGAVSGLRGFGAFEYAGDRLLVANAEYRLPLTTFRKESVVAWNLEFLTFFDTGVAYFSGGSGRNIPGHPALQSRINPRVDLRLPDSYTDLRSDAGAGIVISSRIFYATVQVAQNLHDTSVKPRILFFLHRELF